MNLVRHKILWGIRICPQLSTIHLGSLSKMVPKLLFFFDFAKFGFSAKFWLPMIREVQRASKCTLPLNVLSLLNWRPILAITESQLKLSEGLDIFVITYLAREYTSHEYIDSTPQQHPSEWVSTFSSQRSKNNYCNSSNKIHPYPTNAYHRSNYLYQQRLPVPKMINQTLKNIEQWRERINAMEGTQVDDI